MNVNINQIYIVSSDSYLIFVCPVRRNMKKSAPIVTILSAVDTLIAGQIFRHSRVQGKCLCLSGPIVGT